MIKHRKKENSSTERDRERKKEEREKKLRLERGVKVLWTWRFPPSGKHGAASQQPCGAPAASAPHLQGRSQHPHHRRPSCQTELPSDRHSVGYFRSPASCCYYNITELFDKAHTKRENRFSSIIRLFYISELYYTLYCNYTACSTHVKWYPC